MKFDCWSSDFTDFTFKPNLRSVVAHLHLRHYFHYFYSFFCICMSVSHLSSWWVSGLSGNPFDRNVHFSVTFFTLCRLQYDNAIGLIKGLQKSWQNIHRLISFIPFSLVLLWMCVGRVERRVCSRTVQMIRSDTDNQPSAQSVQMVWDHAAGVWFHFQLLLFTLIWRRDSSKPFQEEVEESSSSGVEMKSSRFCLQSDMKLSQLGFGF